MNRSEKLVALIAEGGLEDFFDKDSRNAFLKAPASSQKRFHHCYEGGLIDHSWEVFEELEKHNIFPVGMCARVALLHDICKLKSYEPNYNKDGETLNGRSPFKTVSKVYGLGHGDLSLLISVIMGIALSKEEQFAIRWHMTSDDFNWKTYRDHVMKVCPKINYVKAADEASAQNKGEP